MGWEDRRSGQGADGDDARSPSERDYARVIHSASFRRLQGKTQILNLGDSDFYRTRLTHSLEVGQVGAGIVRQIETAHGSHSAVSHLPDVARVQALGFTHDLGHPPFGHGGEVALNYCMRGHGGFEGNGQTLRILSKLEKMSRDHGSDLTRRTLLGILKYPVAYSAAFNAERAARLDDTASTIAIIDRTASLPPKCYLDSEADVVEWIFDGLSPADRDRFQELQEMPGKHAKAVHQSFDCSIMNLADDIAYGVHDLEDAIALGLVDEARFRERVDAELAAPFLARMGRSHDDLVQSLFGDGHERKWIIGRLVHHFISRVTIVDDAGFDEPLLRFGVDLPAEDMAFLKALKVFVRDEVIFSPHVQHLEFKGQKMVVSVFEAFQSDPKSFLPRDTFERYEAGGQRVICDHIAGMTDGFLLKTYERFFSPRMGSVFDPL